MFLDGDDDDDDARPQGVVRPTVSVQRSSVKSSDQAERTESSQHAIPNRSRDRSPVLSMPSLAQMAPRPTGTFGFRSSALKSPQTTQNRSLPVTHFASTPKKALEYEEEDADNDGFSDDEEVRLVLDSAKAGPPIASKPLAKRLLQTTLNAVIQRTVPEPLPAIAAPFATEDEPVLGGTSSRTRLRNKIAGFASQGTVVDLEELGSDADVDGEVVEPPAHLEQSLSNHMDDDTLQESEDEVEMQAISDDTDRSGTQVKPADMKNRLDSDVVMETQEEIIDLEDDVSPHVINNNEYILQGQDEDITYLADAETAVVEDTAPSDFRNEILKASPQGEITMRCDINKIRTRAKRRLEIDSVAARNKRVKLGENDMLPEAGITNTDAAQVDRVLSRVIQKEDFVEMDILGQYNLAFIIARRKKPEANGQTIDDIFIIGKFSLLIRTISLG